MEKITFHKLPKSERQVPLQNLPRRTQIAESLTNWQSDSGTFTTAPVHWPVVVRITTSLVKQTRVRSRQPSACFTNLLGETNDALDRVTPRTRESLCAENHAEQTLMLARSKTLTEKARSRPETSSEKSVWQTSTDGAPMPVPIPPAQPDCSRVCPEKWNPCRRHNLRLSHWNRLSRVIFASSSSCRYPVRTWRVKIRIPNVVVHYDDVELSLRRSGEKKDKTRNFSDVHWTWIGRFECRLAVS